MRKQSIKNQVYESIRKDILDGVYNIDAVLNEKTLVEQYQVSKTPVREALVQLCYEGILKNIPRFGYQLTTFSPSEIAEIIQYRKVIEIGALELCFARLSQTEIQVLKDLNQESSRIIHTQNPMIHWENNQIFHRTLCSFCNNQYLQKALSDALNICTRMSHQYFTKLWQESRSSDSSNHIQLVDAIQAGDLNRAKEILSGDVEAFWREIEFIPMG